MKVTWSMLMLAITIIVAIVVLAGIYSPIFIGSEEEPSSIEKMSEESFKFRAGCSENSDCAGNGICKNGQCLCFIDEQCRNKCDKSIGVCI